MKGRPLTSRSKTNCMSCRHELYVTSFFKEIGQYMLNARSWNPIIFQKNVCECLVLVKVSAEKWKFRAGTFSMRLLYFVFTPNLLNASQVFIRSTCLYSKVTLISYLAGRWSYLLLLVLPTKFSRLLYFLGISISLGLSTCHLVQ